MNSSQYIKNCPRPLEKELPKEILNCKSDETPMQWALNKLLILKSSMVQFFPHVIKVGEIILTLPVSNAWSDRASAD